MRRTFPASGTHHSGGKIDMKTAAIQIHDLVRSLGITKARVVGHDIGLMVAYAYAAQFPSEVEKLVVMDAFLPGVQGWEPIYDNPCRLRRSTQHLLGVYLLEFEILEFFLDVDSSAARPGRAALE